MFPSLALSLSEGVGVLAGRLGDRFLQFQGIDWQQQPRDTAAASGCRFFVETRFNLCQPFLGYWERNGGLAVFGFPISAQRDETVEGSWTGPVQWFERDRLEDHSNQALGVLNARIEELQQRIEADIEYINNWSLWLDLTILVRTLGALTGKNAY